MELAAQGGLIDHPGRASFVIQRRAVNRHHHTVGAGLAIRQYDMSVQMRVPAPRGLVLIGDRHQSGQAHEVFFSGERVVHPGVAGMRGQVFHRLGQCGGVGVGDRLGDHVISAHRPDERQVGGTTTQPRSVLTRSPTK